MNIKKELKLNDGNIYYWINKNENSNICLFCSHGVTADHRCFEKQLNEFKDKYTIITWDMPMHGESKNYDFKTYKDCADIMNKILDKENIDKVILLGFSLGGYLSQMFINQYPNKVLGFIAIDTSSFGNEYYSKSDKFWLKQVEWMSKCFPLNLLKKSMAKQSSYMKDSYDLMMMMYDGVNKKEISRQLGIAYGEFIKENKDMYIQCPTIIIVGKNDKVGKVKKYCFEWNKKTNFPLYIIPNAGHFSNNDNYKEVNNIIYDFINKLKNIVEK